VIVKAVEQGQIISSATSQVTGGTTLLTLANLDTLQVRTLVDETDIGKIRSGLQAEISVEAYPRELFAGQVLKVEPQAVTVQNVTTFPVLVRIVNERGLLMPGMNVDVEIRTDAREDALTLPTEALRTERDYLVAAGALGLETEEAVSLFESAQDEDQHREGKPNVVFLVENGRPRPVPVGVGVSNWDYAEILWGLAETDSVAATLSTSMLMQQERWRNRMSRFSSMGGFKKTDEQKAGSSQNKSGAHSRRPENGGDKSAGKSKPSESKGSGSH
jgi:multidrug efflux pump subunit AcrA (membrane-fusion protein)